jgi:RNA polymerase sigma-70 factor (ECF subfamily)
VKEIITFIKTMDEKYRDVLSLYFLHELNFREISIALNKPVSTIKDRFHKGHKLVIEKFKEYRK